MNYSFSQLLNYTRHWSPLRGNSINFLWLYPQSTLHSHKSRIQLERIFLSGLLYCDSRLRHWNATAQYKQIILCHLPHDRVMLLAQLTIDKIFIVTWLIWHTYIGKNLPIRSSLWMTVSYWYELCYCNFDLLTTKDTRAVTISHAFYFIGLLRFS